MNPNSILQAAVGFSFFMLLMLAMRFAEADTMQDVNQEHVLDAG